MGRFALGAAMLGGLLACGEPATLPSPASPSIAAAGRQGATIHAHDLDLAALPVPEREELSALYPATENAPVWVDAVGRPTRTARDALVLALGAGVEGLDPADYDADRLAQLASRLETADTPAAADIAAFDTGLSLGMLRYLRHLHIGRVNPRAIGFRMTNPADEHDFAALVRSAVGGHGIVETAADLTPPLVLYRALRTALAGYRHLAATSTFDELPDAARSVHPGETTAAVRALRQRLAAFGDLEAGAVISSTIYEGPLVEAVRHFQARHGLATDGVLGKGTLGALRLPLARRVRQIELALERLRWLPHLGPGRFLAVNIPMFQLWAWDTAPPTGSPTLGMRVIVGRALDTETPVFVEQMRQVIFRPYWNVPVSILQSESLPALARDRDYLIKQDMEIVAGPADESPPLPMTPDNIERLRTGSVRLRQRPGPANSLGLIKFVFPNDDNVYMHGTPARQLFGRPRRDFSHGCIRVEDPARLAEWALADQPGWTRQRILEAMDAESSAGVDLRRPIQVILFYVTAVVMPDDGTVHFADDIYGHDATLERALAARRSH